MTPEIAPEATPEIPPSSGQVIGVTTAIRANAAGIGFAIPIDSAEAAMKELAAGRRAQSNRNQGAISA